MKEGASEERREQREDRRRAGCEGINDAKRKGRSLLKEGSEKERDGVL